MLIGSRRFWLVSALLATGTARAAGSLEEPERFTSGAADEFLGVLDPAGDHLYYVTNEHTSNEIYTSEVSSRTPKILFDESADVTAPRVSPDGQRILYISHRSAATGQPCFRELPKPGHDISDRHCFSIEGRTAIQALWEPDSKAVLVVSRNGLASQNGSAEDIDVRRFPLDGSHEEVVLSRDVSSSSPALSPDGRWFLYPSVTPPDVASEAAQPGTKPGRTLTLVRLDDPTEEARLVKFALPGQPVFPAFSPDGRFVYFAQYLNDTNHDGKINANDRAVVFRAPFDPSRADPIDAAHPQQLTTAGWDCHDPFPGRERLLVTCFRDDSLDIYSLPLDGMLPMAFSREKLEDEIRTNRDAWDRLLVYTRLYENDTEATDRAFHLKRIVEMHLNLHEYQSAGFYSKQLEELAANRPEPAWQEEEGIGHVLHELARHRRSDQTLDEGGLQSEYIAGAKQRLQTLEKLRASRLPAVAALASLAMSEVNEHLGDVGTALSLLEEVHPAADARPVVLHLLGQRARALYLVLNETEKLLEMDRFLSQHPALDESERVQYAEDYVHDLLDAQPKSDRASLLAEAAKHAEAGSAVAFTIELAQTLVALSPRTEADAQKRIFALLDRNDAYARQRTIVRETSQESKKAGCAELRYQVAKKFIQSVGKGHADRRRMELLYRNAGMDRAFADWAGGDLANAEKHFESVTKHVPDLEAHAGYLETGLLRGRTDLDAEYRKKYGDKKDSAELNFAEAYLESRQLKTVSGDVKLRQADQDARDHLKIARRQTRNSVAVFHLSGYLHHQLALRLPELGERLIEGDKANTQYQVALDLAGHDDPRYRAATLSALGFLHTSLKNFSIATDYFEERERLGFISPISDFSVCVMHARALLHNDHLHEAAALSDDCVKRVDAAPALTKFLPYALDRAAYQHLDAGEYEPALVQYDRLRALQEKAPDKTLIDRRNRFVVLLGRASANLGAHRPAQALPDLAAADALLHLPGGIPKASGAYSGSRKDTGAFKQEAVFLDYEILLSGLRAQALEQTGDVAAADVQLAARVRFLEQRIVGADDEAGKDDARFLALAEVSMAAHALRAGDLKSAVAHADAGLGWADDLEKRTLTPVSDVALLLVQLYARLHFDGHVLLKELRLDLPGRLARLYGELSDRPQPRWLSVREHLGLYVDRLMIEGVPVQLQPNGGAERAVAAAAAASQPVGATAALVVK